MRAEAPPRWLGGLAGILALAALWGWIGLLRRRGEEEPPPVEGSLHDS